MKRLLAVFFAALGRLLVAVALAAAALPAMAQEDLPGRAGRLADVGGRVYLATEDRAEDWVEALRNYTVTTGDNLWVAGDGRAEVDYGGGQFRLAGDTNVHVARLDDRILALFVAQGRVIVRLRVLDPGESVRIDTPNTQVLLTRPGLYRVEVAPDRSRTDVVVREGEALAQFVSGTQQVLPGQSATLTGAEPAQVDVRTGYWIDGFDTWSAERDRRYERSRTARYVSPQMVGYADLDEYGRWDTVPEYGAIWYPTTVAAGWAPYRYGRWSWVGGWGWTWVDDAPWGYAPFHYGRWAYVGGRWGWCPGGYVARPVWSPAMVAWYGGGGWSFSASFGAPVYGWVPLGWGEPYMPWWRGCSDRCWTMYNRPYAVNYAERPNAPPTRYVNWSAPGGVTAVAGATFTGRQPVHRHLVDVKPQMVSAAPVLAQAPVLAKPTAATIPGAKPTTTAVPPPASHFYRTKPMQAAPGPGTAVAPGQAGRPGTTWGGAVPSAGSAGAPATATRPGGAATKPGAATAVAPGAQGAVPPGQARRPDATWGGAPPRAATSAPPAAAKPGAQAASPAVGPGAATAAPPAAKPAPMAAPSQPAGRPAQAGTHSQGTWGAQPARPQGGTAGAPGRPDNRPVPSAPAPRYESRAAPPSSAPPSGRAAPVPQGGSGSYAPPPPGAPASRAGPSGHPPVSAPPAQHAPPPPSAAPAPQQRSGGADRGDKPKPRGEGDKPGERQQ